MCKLTKNLPIQGGCWILRIQGGRFDKGRGNSGGGGGVETPLELWLLCFGTSEINCSAS